MSRDTLIKTLAELEPKLRAEGVTHMALFGSRARQDNRTNSDVDVAIDVDPTAKFSLIDLVGVAHHIEDETALSANVFMRRSFDEDFKRTVARDAIEIF
ncbi:nucleotidyltransferase domain-containing protein [Methylopila sp. M107]|uniref:nucleotidyltransferase family protein n=1 Tax=Methylopila sp. M107 TaxID=1101190 RepID=UPI0003A54B50|nr:nucleotidyltransferase domain-containing protein [Methylopila sp. M107]